jgi:hypothetical protein
MGLYGDSFVFYLYYKYLISQRRNGLLGHAARIVQNKNRYRDFVGNSEEEKKLECLAEDGRQ